jgi:hypothetical protein
MTSRIVHYANDGSGRDLYISSNNAGFYKEYRIINTNTRQFEPYRGGKSFYNPVFSKPLNRYYCDGMGRDHYIFSNNSRNFAMGSAGIDLPSILRNDDFDTAVNTSSSNPALKSIAKGNNRVNRMITKNVLKRVFYGNAEGVKDRRMSPKVQFNKKYLELCAERGHVLNDNVKDCFKYKYYYDKDYAITENNMRRSLKTMNEFNSNNKYRNTMN